MEVMTATDTQQQSYLNIDEKVEFCDAEIIDFGLNPPIPTVMIFNFEDDKTTKNVLKMEECAPKADDENQEEKALTSNAPILGENVTVLPPKKKREEANDREHKKKKKKKKVKLEKPKKWKPVSCSSVGINLTLFPRPTKNCEFEGDIDHLLHEIEEELNEFEKKTENFTDVLEREENTVSELKYLRPSKHRKIEKAQNQIKTKYCKNVRNNNGKKLYVNHRVLKRMELPERTFPYLPLKNPNKTKTIVENKELQKQQSKTVRNSTWQKTDRAAPVQNLAHALDTSNNPGHFEAGVLSLLINLQHRDLTPEDYELLSILDQTVAPKTVTEQQLNSFRSEKVGESLVDKLCSVCLEAYALGQTVKYLPCGHEFHSHCIDMWLSNSSLNCPLDGLPVNDS